MVVTPKVLHILCTFRPQAWQRDYAIDVDPEGRTTWEMDVSSLPCPHSYESDQLREDAAAPTWVREWTGPFEVEFVVVVPRGGQPCQ